MERHFDSQIEKLKTRLIKMCSLVNEQVELAVRAIEEANAELAEFVVDRDKKVDKYDVKVDKICMKLFALNQPVAMDLRLIMSSLTINTNLERVGDLAANIARFAREISKKPEYFNELQFREIANMAMEMVRIAIDSFIENDPELAKTVLEMENDLDEMVHKNHKLLIEIMKRNCDYIDTAVMFYTIFNHFERLGDHSTNIAEDVFFIVEAQNIKHRYYDILFNDEEDDDNESEDDNENESKDKNGDKE